MAPRPRGLQLLGFECKGLHNAHLTISEARWCDSSDLIFVLCISMKQTLDFHFRGIDPRIAACAAYAAFIGKRQQLQIEPNARANRRNDPNNLQKFPHVGSGCQFGELSPME